MSKDNAQSITGKVFDADSNEVTARLLVWGPEDVDGERCVIAEPTDFFDTAPNPHYEGQAKPVHATDDLRIAIPVRFFTDKTLLAEIATMAERAVRGGALSGGARAALCNDVLGAIGEKARAAASSDGADSRRRGGGARDLDPVEQRAVQACYNLSAWLADPETDGADAGDVLVEELRRAGF
jgi:hypothetical protein